MIHYPCLPVPLASPNPERFAYDWLCVEAQVTVKAVQSLCEISHSSLLISCLHALSLIRSIICIYLSLSLSRSHFLLQNLTLAAIVSAKIFFYNHFGILFKQCKKLSGSIRHFV